MDYTLTVMGVLSLAIAHMGWLITQSGLMRPLRERLANISYDLDKGMLGYRLVLLQSVLAEGVHCSICTMTQLSLALAWLVPDVIACPEPLGYVLKAMLLAKVSCLVYDLGEALGSIPLIISPTASDGDTDP